MRNKTILFNISNYSTDSHIISVFIFHVFILDKSIFFFALAFDVCNFSSESCFTNHHTNLFLGNIFTRVITIISLSVSATNVIDYLFFSLLFSLWIHVQVIIRNYYTLIYSMCRWHDGYWQGKCNWQAE